MLLNGWRKSCVVRGSRAEFPHSLFYPIRTFDDGAVNLRLRTDFLQLLQQSQAQVWILVCCDNQLGFGKSFKKNLMFWQLNKASEKNSSLTSGTKILWGSPRPTQHRPFSPHNCYCTALSCPQLSETGMFASRCWNVLLEVMLEGGKIKSYSYTWPFFQFSEFCLFLFLSHEFPQSSNAS